MAQEVLKELTQLNLSLHLDRPVYLRWMRMHREPGWMIAADLLEKSWIEEPQRHLIGAQVIEHQAAARENREEDKDVQCECRNCVRSREKKGEDDEPIVS
jgi:hypothetical protein